MDRAGHLGPFHAVPLGLVMPALSLPSAQKGGLRGDGRRAAQQAAELRHRWWRWGHPEAAVAAARPPWGQPGSAGGRRAGRGLAAGGGSAAVNAGSLSLSLAARVSSPALCVENVDS